MKQTYFWFGCVLLRGYLTWIAQKASLDTLKYMGYAALIPVLGWLRIILWAPRDYAPEAQGKVWWQRMRPVHVFFYSMFAYDAINGSVDAWVWLALDLIFGVSGWLFHYHFLSN